MRLWILIVLLVCVVQESTSANAVLLAAYQAHYSIWIIHALFVGITALEIALLYGLGRVVRARYPKAAAIGWVERMAASLRRSTGRSGERVGIVILGAVNFIQLDAFALAWLSKPFWEIFLLLFVGDLIAYAAQWAVVLGAHLVFPNTENGIVVIVVLSAAGLLILRLVRRGPTRL